MCGLMWLMILSHRTLQNHQTIPKQPPPLPLRFVRGRGYQAMRRFGAFGAKFRQICYRRQCAILQSSARAHLPAFCQCQYNRQRHFAFAKIAPDFLAGIAPFIIQTIINQLKSQTANLFEIAAAGPAILAGHRREKALSEYGKRLGLAFQLVDDCLDYEGGDTGKEVGRDFSEGKMTLPVILALAKMPEMRARG